jgi:hypothetical protein
MSVRILSKEEHIQYIIEMETKMKNWFEKLSYYEKNLIYKQYKPIIRQMNCDHVWVKSTLYGEPILECKCGIIKNI